MGAWAYCKKCEAPLNYPTLKQVLDQNLQCENCGIINDPLKTRNEVLIELYEDVETIKRTLNNHGLFE